MIDQLLVALRSGYRIVGIQRFAGHDCWKLEREDYERANFIPLPDGWVAPDKER